MDPAPQPTPEVEPVVEDTVPPADEASDDSDASEDESEVAAVADDGGPSALKLGLGAFSVLLALAAALFGLVLWRRSREDEEAPATF